jgi:high-affinity Fe2+/Pb2+ permease
MGVNEAVTRGYNFFVVAFLGIAAGSLVGEVPQEGLWVFRLDELLIIAVAIGAIVWYLLGQHRYQRSLVPLALAFAAFAAKVLGLIIEFKYTVESGDDYTMVQALLLLVIVAGVVYYRTRASTLEAAGTRGASQMPSQRER